VYVDEIISNRILVSDTVAASLGGASLQELKKYAIPAGRFNGNALKLRHASFKVGTSGSSQIRLRINSTDNFATSEIIQAWQLNAANLSSMGDFLIPYNGTQLISATPTSALNVSFAQFNVDFAKTTINLNNAFWLYISVQNFGSGDVAGVEYVEIEM
jgi:hypothetical protein